MLESMVLKAVLSRLGLAASPSKDRDGLMALYAAWCGRVPFDNLRKLIALHGGATGSLPGMQAQEFFQAWLEHGCGATCWPSSNALYELLRALGFDCRRVTGSMRDCARINHGSVVVSLEKENWLADSSMLTLRPIPLGRGVYRSPDPVFDHETENEGEEFVVWNDFAPIGLFPCRLFPGTADWAEYSERYEGSREMSPFNRRIYARRAEPGRVAVLSGTSFYLKTADGLTTRECSGGEVLALLRDEFGHSPELVDQWVASGGAANNHEPPPADAPPPPPIKGVPPSRRGR